MSLCDENVQPLDFNADVDLVGISFMTAYAPRAYEIAAEFRRRGKITVAGGYHPTFMTDEVARHFDAVVVGDAEELWPRVVRDAENGTLRPMYRHVTPPSLRSAPPPRRELTKANARHYVTINAVQAGRGCPNRCRYCSVTAFHQGTHRLKMLKNILEELAHIGRDFIFVDDNIIADPEYARRLFHAMVPLRKRWVSQASITIADDIELLRLARRAGCQGLFIGIETTSSENLAAVNKGFNDASKCRDRARLIRREGIGVIAGMIVGLDGDDVHVFQNTIRFLQKIHVDALQLNILTPLPGTPLFDDFERAGRITDHDWSHYDFRHVVLRPARMSPEELQMGADWLYREFYRMDRILLRIMRTLFTVGPTQALLAFRLNWTYRYDNKRERIVGRNPARTTPVAARFGFLWVKDRLLRGQPEGQALAIARPHQGRP